MLDASSVTGSYPMQGSVFEAGYQGVARYVRAQVVDLTPGMGVPSVTATVASV